MKAKKVLGVGFLVVLLAAAGGAWWLYSSLDGLVKQAIERWGPEITGVSVKVASVKIEATQGRGTIRGLVVGSPKGFDAPQTLKVGEMRLTLDPASLTKDVVVVKELLLVAPEVTYERGQGSDNMAVIQKHAEDWVAKNAGAKKDAGPGKKFVIENLILRDGRVHFGTTLSSALPDLHLRDVGRKTNGATAGEVVKQVWGALWRSVGNLATAAGAAVKEGAKGVVEGVKNLFK